MAQAVFAQNPSGGDALGRSDTVGAATARAGTARGGLTRPRGASQFYLQMAANPGFSGFISGNAGNGMRMGQDGVPEGQVIVSAETFEQIMGYRPGEEEDDKKMEENNHDKVISSLELDRDMGFLRGHQTNQGHPEIAG